MLERLHTNTTTKIWVAYGNSPDMRIQGIQTPPEVYLLILHRCSGPHSVSDCDILLIVHSVSLLLKSVYRGRADHSHDRSVLSFGRSRLSLDRSSQSCGLSVEKCILLWKDLQAHVIEEFWFWMRVNTIQFYFRFSLFLCNFLVLSKLRRNRRSRRWGQVSEYR